MKIGIIGGGAAGLYLARLIKLHAPQHTVDVVEQNAPDATFGFGVGLGDGARGRIKALDPELHDRMAAGMVFSNSQNIQLNDDATLIEYTHSSGAIGRLELLRILQDACREAGASVRHNVRAEGVDIFAGYDLIVGADGVNSVVRRADEAAFGTYNGFLTNRFAWYGVGRPMRPGSLVFRETGLGRFVAHYYPYSETMSTLVAECDAETWDSSGLAAMSDPERRSLIENVFAPELEGDPLVDNRSIWRQFPIVENERWSSGNIVLLGDALLSAHFSIGSGTRLAMDDAEALFSALQETGNVEAALARFEEIRRPSRELFRVAAKKSYMWYENLSVVMQQEPLDFVYNFLTRTGRVDDARLAEYAPGFYGAWREARASARPALQTSA